MLLPLVGPVHRADGPRHAPVGAARVRAHAPHVCVRLRPARRRPGHVDRVLRPDRRRRAARVDDGASGEGQGDRPNAKVSLCILDERWPFTFLQVYADATIERDLDVVVDVMMAVGGRMSGQELSDDARPIVQAMAEEEKRVVIRCRPYLTFATPPRHLHDEHQDEQLTHWVSGSVPWDAADPA